MSNALLSISNMNLTSSSYYCSIKQYKIKVLIILFVFMKALPTQKRALLKRSALIDAAIIEFSKFGFEIATAKSIAAEAGVATGTFYQYFDNKNEILSVIASMRNDELRRSIDWNSMQSIDEVQTVKDFFKQNLKFVYQFHSSNPELHQVLEQRRDLDKKLNVIMEEGDSVLSQRTLRFVQSYNIDNPEVVAQNLFAMAEGIVHRQVFHGSKLNSELVITVGANMLAQFFLDQ